MELFTNLSNFVAGDTVCVEIENGKITEIAYFDHSIENGEIDDPMVFEEKYYGEILKNLISQNVRLEVSDINIYPGNKNILGEIGKTLHYTFYLTEKN